MEDRSRTHGNGDRYSDMAGSRATGERPERHHGHRLGRGRERVHEGPLRQGGTEVLHQQIADHGQDRRTGSRSLCVALIAALFSLALADSAVAGLIAIEWDRSSDPSIIGYRVSVGTSPGAYTETFDVGPRTYFVYVAQDSRQYYFAVASYAAGPRVGPLSPAISATARPPIGSSPPALNDPRSFYGYLWSNAVTLPSGAEPSAVDESRRVFSRGLAAPRMTTVCWTPSTDCLSIQTLTRVNTVVTSLSASRDGRLFFIEDGQWVGVISSDVLQAQAVVAAGAGVRLGQIALDPMFHLTGFLYVSEIGAGAGGSCELRVVRYRVAENLAGEGDALVNIPMPSCVGTGDFTVTSDGHVYVAVPAAAGGQQTAHSGMLLRFNVDGTVPGEQSGSPTFATGYATPTAIVFDGLTQRLWLAGVDDAGRPSVSSLGERTSALLIPAVSLATSAGANGNEYLFAASGEDNMGRAIVAADGSLETTSQLTIGTGLIHSVAAGLSGDLYLAVQAPSAAGFTTSILRLTPTQSR